MSPEMVQNKPYDYKIDIWALGILLFELISGRAPFKGNSPDEVLDQMKTKIFFGDKFSKIKFILVPEEIELIKSILRVTPHKRPTIK
jgi:serine/threonine protein kinase